jgi:phage gp36-like protein
VTRYAEREHLYKWGAPRSRLLSIRAKLKQDAEDADAPLTDEQLDDAFDAALDALLDGASALGDTYIRKGATLPLASWTDALRMAIAKMAAFDGLCNVGINPMSEASDAVILGRNKEALRWLEMAAQGKVEPGWVDASVDDDEREGYAISDPPRRWSPHC